MAGVFHGAAGPGLSNRRACGTGARAVPYGASDGLAVGPVHNADTAVAAVSPGAPWRGPRCWYFADLWESYVGALPRWQHRRSPKGSGGTSIVEAINCALRQRCGVLVRKSCSFSKCIRIHFARIKFVIEHHNLNIIPH